MIILSMQNKSSFHCSLANIKKLTIISESERIKKKVGIYRLIFIGAIHFGNYNLYVFKRDVKKR